MTLHSNGGMVSTRMQCSVENLNQPVWYSPDYITNILSLSLIEKLYRVTYDSADEPAFIVHHDEKPPLRFEKHSNGLHLMQLDKPFSFVQSLVKKWKGIRKEKLMRQG